MIARLKKIPLTWIAFAIVLLPMLYVGCRDLMMLPLVYGHTLGPSDPDPWVRLTLVRDWMQSGDWYSHAITHSDAPFGHTVSPWTRPLDIVIALLTTLQPHHIDLSTRLLHTALLLPILWMAVLLAGLFHIARRLCDAPLTVLMVGVLVADAPMMKNYFGSGNADHHGMLASIFVWAMVAVITPAPSARSITLSGVLFGLLLWISPEILPILAAVYGWYGLRWLTVDARALTTLRMLSTSVAATSSIALMLERPSSNWFTALYDTISIIHVLPLSLAAAATWILHALPLHNWRSRALIAGVFAVAILTLTHHLYPLIFRGLSAATDPFIIEKFLPNISEMRSLFSPENSSFYIAAMLTQPLIALLFLYLSLGKPISVLKRPHVFQLMYFMLITGTLYILHLRFYYYFYPFLVLALAPLLSALLSPSHLSVADKWPSRWLAHHTDSAQATRRLPILLVILALPLVLIVLTPDDADTEKPIRTACENSATSLIQTGELLRLLGDRPHTLFLPTGLGGHVLFFTPYRIVASNYHREGVGLRYMSEAEEITSPEVLRTHLAKRRVDALLLCPQRIKNPDNTLDLLYHGKLSAPWLIPVHYSPPPLKKEEREQREKNGIINADPQLFLIR